MKKIFSIISAVFLLAGILYLLGIKVKFEKKLYDSEGGEPIGV